MADPKYAGLPGIITDGPDVFETTDELPEDDQHQAKQEAFENENVEAVTLDADKAFDRFKGKQLASSDTDFSDKLKKYKNTGYGSWVLSEYEMLEQGSKKETPQQKFQRLQHEIKELDTEVKNIKEAVVSDSSQDKLSPVELSKQVEYLQQQLTGLHLENVLGPQAQVDLTDPHGSVQKRLLSQLESFKKGKRAPSKSPAKADKTATSGDSVTYELYYKPEQAAFERTQKVAELEQRLDRLEAVVGEQPEKLATLTSSLTNKSLMGAVEELTARTSLLDPDNLGLVEGRLQAIHTKLNQLSEKRAVIDETKQSKISELYDMVKAWDDLAVSLPHIVDRMAALKELHEQAMQFTSALTYLDTVQQQLSKQLETHTGMQKQLDSQLQENMKTIKDNCESIDKRLKAIMK